MPEEIIEDVSLRSPALPCFSAFIATNPAFSRPPSNQWFLSALIRKQVFWFSDHSITQSPSISANQWSILPFRLRRFRAITAIPAIPIPLPWCPTASHVIPDWRAFEKDRVSHHPHVADHAHVAPPRGPLRARCWLAGVEVPSAVFPPDLTKAQSSSESLPRKPPSLPACPSCTCRRKASIPPAVSAVPIRAHSHPSAVSALLYQCHQRSSAVRSYSHLRPLRPLR